MAVAFVKNHTAASNKTAGTTLALSLDTDVPAGNLIVCRMVYDNAATASKPVISSIGVAAGETASWIGTASNALSTSTTAGSFASGGMRYLRTTVIWPAGSYTVTLDTSTVQKAGFFQEFSGVTTSSSGAQTPAYSTTTTAASATAGGGLMQAGDLGIGFIFGSNVATAQAGDNDTTNGSWSTPFGFGSTGGNVATNNFGIAQHKIVTAAGTQTLNNSAAMTAGNGAIVVVLQQYVPPSITQAAYQFFDDAGTESGAASLAAVNTPVTGDIANGDGIGALRIRLQNTTAIAGISIDDYQLQWEKNASGSWTNVADSLYATAASVSLGGTSIASGKYNSQSFMGDGLKLASISIRVRKLGAGTTGTISGALYSHTGTYGSATGLPLALMAVSTNTIDVVPLSATNPGNWVTFYFDGTTDLNVSTPYCLVLDASLVTGGIPVYTGTKPGGSGSTATSSDGSTWSGVGTTSYDFNVLTYKASLGGHDNPNLTDGAVTTNRLGAGTGSFQAGEVSEDGHVDDIALNASAYTEILYSLRIRASDVAHGDTLRFRVLCNGATTQMTYSQTPTINIIQTPIAITQASYRIYDDGTETGAVALAAQDTAANGDITSGDGIGQLRVRLQSTTAAPIPATDDWQLQYEKNASGVWLNASASAVRLVDQYNESNLDSSSAVGVGSSSLISYGQTFLGDGSKLVRAEFWVRKFNSPTGPVQVALYAHTGTFGSNGMSTGSPLAVSASVEASTLNPTTFTVQAFDFDGTFTLQTGVPYALVVEPKGTDATNLVSVCRDGSSPSHAGNVTFFHAVNGWEFSATSDVVFKVYTFASVAAYASPNVTDGAATTNRLGAGSGSFVAGEISETGLVTDLGWSGNNYTELLFPLAIKKPEVVAGDVIRFRILRNGATTEMTYTAVPTVNVVTSGTNVAATIASNWSEPQLAATAGMVGWWNADDASTFSYSSGAVVSQWRDKSPNAFHFDTTTAGPVRNGTVNGRTTVTFDGISQHIRRASVALTKPYALFAVAKSAVATGQGNVFIMNPDGRIFQTATGEIAAYQGVFLASGIQWGTTQPHLATTVFNGSSSKIGVDGSALTTGDAGTYTPSTGGSWAIGSHTPGSSEFWNGDICEALAYDHEPTTVERQQIESYLLRWLTPVGWAAATGTVTAGGTNIAATISSVWGGVVFGDTFDRSDLAAPGLGSGWSAPDWGIGTNKAARQNAPAGSDYARFLTDIGSTDQWVEMSHSGLANGDYRVINCRMDAALGQNGILGFIDVVAGSVCKIGKVQGGTYSDIAVGSSVTQTDPQTFRLECQGTTARLYHNGTQVATGSIAGLTLGTFAGMNANVNNATMDNFRCGPLPYGAGGWMASAAGTVSGPAPTDVAATAATNWGTWTGTFTGTRGQPATGAQSWGTWAGTFTATRDQPATATTTAWGTWVGTFTAVVNVPATATSTTWGTWTGTFTGTRGQPATALQSWGTWAGTFNATVSGAAPAWGIPQNVAAVSTGTTTVTVTWDAVSAATGYDIERNGVVVKQDHAASPFLDTGLLSNTSYTYRVRAVG